MFSKIDGILDDAFDFKEPLEVVDLAEGHSHEEKGFKNSPPHHTRVSVVIDCW